MSEPLPIEDFAAAMRAYADAYADSGPFGAWPGGPHPAWTAAALAFIALSGEKGADTALIAGLPDGFWAGCGFAARPGDARAVSGLGAAINTLVEYPFLPPPLLELRDLLAARANEMGQLTQARAQADLLRRTSR